MKKLKVVFLLMALLITSVLPVRAEASDGDGFRTALEQNGFAQKVVGGQAKFKVPTRSNINAIYESGNNKIYPEFFVSINSINGAVFDGGIMLQGNEWYAILFGGSGSQQIWKQVPLGNLYGKTVDIKLVGENEGGNYVVNLYIDNAKKITIDKNTKDYNGNNLGWIAENPYYSGLLHVKYELNISSRC